MFGWILSVGIIATVTFSTYDMVKEEGDGPVMWSKERLVAWEVLSRSAWAVCICWMIFSIHYGGGGTDCFWISLHSLLENCALILPKMLWFEFSLTLHEDVCIKFVIFAGCLRAMINWKTWVPLARLVYTSYLIHAVVISRFIYAQMSLVDMTQDNMVRLQEIEKSKDHQD